MSTQVVFSTPDLARVVEGLSPQEIDALPFGVIGIDPHGDVRVYSATEARLSGRGHRPILSKAFFADIAPCMDNDLFRGRIEAALKTGRLDIRFQFTGDFADRNRIIFVRAMAASDGGLWLFHNRVSAAP